MLDISDKFQDKLKKFSKQAKDTFDYAKMEIKIKAYGRECKKRYTKIGMLVYDSRKKSSSVNGEEIEQICREIDKYKYRIKVIQKQIEDFKSKEKKEKNTENYTEDEVVYNSLPEKETVVKLLRFCPECGIGNEQSVKACVKCGHKFEK